MSPEDAKQIAVAVADELEERQKRKLPPVSPKTFSTMTGIPLRTVYHRIKAGSIKTIPGCTRIPYSELRRFTEA